METKKIEPFDITQMEERQEAASHGSANVEVSSKFDPWFLIGGKIYF